MTPLALVTQITVPSPGFISKSPASFQRTWTKLLKPCHIKPGPRSQKISTSTVLVYSWLTPYLLLQCKDRRSKMCDFGFESWFIWLRCSNWEIHLHIQGYHFTERNRTADPLGGVGCILKNNNNIKFKSLAYLHDPHFQRMRTWLRPTRLPRGITFLIAGPVYHPQQSTIKRQL